jgi:hypothetical protein
MEEAAVIVATGCLHGSSYQQKWVYEKTIIDGKEMKKRRTKALGSMTDIGRLPEGNWWQFSVPFMFQVKLDELHPMVRSDFLQPKIYFWADRWGYTYSENHILGYVNVSTSFNKVISY